MEPFEVVAKDREPIPEPDPSSVTYSRFYPYLATAMDLQDQGHSVAFFFPGTDYDDEIYHAMAWNLDMGRVAVFGQHQTDAFKTKCPGWKWIAVEPHLWDVMARDRLVGL